MGLVVPSSLIAKSVDLTNKDTVFIANPKPLGTSSTFTIAQY